MSATQAESRDHLGRAPSRYPVGRGRKARGQLDGRTRAARVLRAVRADLTAHVGGNPSATQKALIERAAVLSVQLDRMDRKALIEGMSDSATRVYLAWSNSLARTLRSLGLEAAPQRVLTPAEAMALHPMQRGAA